MTDFAQRRTMMVDTQVRPNEVTSYPVIEAMLHVPREQFVPDTRRDVAYAGEDIALAPGRVLLEPRTLGKMIDMLDLQPGDLVIMDNLAAHKVAGVREAIEANARQKTAVASNGAKTALNFPGREPLTSREQDVLDCIMKGESNKEAARRLGISPRTIEVHRSRIMEKLEAKNAADLIRIVMSEGRAHP